MFFAKFFLNHLIDFWYKDTSSHKTTAIIPFHKQEITLIIIFSCLNLCDTCHYAMIYTRVTMINL
jgi:hypothetical protein